MPFSVGLVSLISRIRSGRSFTTTSLFVKQETKALTIEPEIMGKKRFQANGFWLFAQIRKKINDDKGCFKDYVEVADSIWKEMTEDQKLYWRGMALGFRRTSQFQNMKAIHKKLQNARTESEVKDLKLFWTTYQRVLCMWFLFNVREVFDD